ncbi:MAG: lipid A export permease/ATP-binding protein MsbA [Gammaproteobacteria bacterium]|nr:lipid A export permease/ATP-binding protein MsbA [Gammaproteobacteria bacterium]
MSVITEHSASGFSIYRRLLTYLRPFRVQALLVLLGMTLAVAGEVSTAWLVKDLVDKGFIEKDASFIAIMPWLLLGVGLARGLGNFISDYFMNWIGRAVIKHLRYEMFTKVLRMPTKLYDTSTSGELIAIFTYNVEQLAESCTTVITTSIKDTAVVLGLIGMMFYLHPPLASVFLIAGPLAALIIVSVSSRLRKASKRIQKSVGGVTHIVGEAVDGNQVVKIFGGQDGEQRVFESVNQSNFRENMRLVFTRQLSTFLIQLSGGAVLAAIVYVAASGTVGVVTAGIFSTFLTSMVRIYPALKHVSSINAQLQKAIAAAQSIFDLLDGEEEVDEGKQVLVRASGQIEFRNINFSYGTDKVDVLKNISLKADAGKTIALVGRSGSGKSTLVKLIPRLYDFSRGDILLDGRSIKEYRLADLRDQISFVGQNVTLFHDTVANNIAYGRLSGAPREDIIAAAKAAHAMEFIEQLPDGLDTMVGENGILLSGGQRQRLAIARALLKDAPILILDEATSALDSESEQYIQAALDKLIQNRTTFVIAHRLSTVENADLILVMDKSEIVEIGNHHELLKKNGQYASLHRIQFKTDSVEDERLQRISPAVSRAEFDEDAEDSEEIILYQQHNFLSEQKGASIWDRMWYGHHPLAQLLAPLGYVFGLLATTRRLMYRWGMLKRKKMPVPVIVIGNITVGGTGKTPLVIWMALHLQKLGYRPGIVSRGYKGKAKEWPLLVTENTDPRLCGDEPLLVVKRTQCPVVIAPSRPAAAQALLEWTDCDIIISDDGLQHYALERDIEIVVADGARGFGNGLLLPAGPMRETKTRLQAVDYVIVNGARLPGAYSMRVKGDMLINLADINQQRPLQTLHGLTVHAVAAIGNPERFFDLLRRQGLEVIEHRFMDHHSFSATNLRFNNDFPVVMTEKDAVKCGHLVSKFPPERLWYLPIEAVLAEEFVVKLDNQLKALNNGPQTT